MTYIFVLLVMPLSPTPNFGVLPVQAYRETYATRLACETNAPAKAASLVGKGQKYAFKCVQFQVGP